MAKFGIMAWRDFIYVKYTHQQQRFEISTRYSTENLYNPRTKSWNQEHPDFKAAKTATDDIMNDMLTASHRVRTAGFEPTCHMVRQEYNKLLLLKEKEKEEVQAPQNRGPKFWDKFDEFMKAKDSDIRLRTYMNYIQLMDLLRRFEHFDKYTMDFNTFDQVMFGRFKQYMILVEKYKDSTVDKYIKYLRGIYKWTMPQLDRSFMKFSPRFPDNPNPLTPEELKYVIDAELGGYLEKTRDLFVFCACTGMRYSDSQLFKRSWVKDGLINYTQLKSDSKAMVPLLDAANKILVKYGYDTPKMSNPRYNVYLKELFTHLDIDRYVTVESYVGGKREMISKHFHEIVTTHTARQTFITYALTKGVPVQDVMIMSGHNDYRSMRPYIAISQDHIREQGKILDI